MACRLPTIFWILLLLTLFTVMSISNFFLSVTKAHPLDVSSLNNLISSTMDGILPGFFNEPALQPAIPHKLIFLDTRYTSPNELPKHFYDNIMRTVSHYREAWHEPNAPISFLGNKECLQAINATEPRLLPFFDNETIGTYLADMCRVAALYISGGYYFDTDMQSLKAVELEPDTVFSTATEYGGKGLFISFLASAPKHPILSEALRLMLGYYHNEVKVRQGSHMGTSIMKDAFEAVPEAERGETFVLDEILLKEDPYYRDFPRHNGTGCCCDFVVADKSKKQIHFYSRMLGAGKNCDFRKDDPRRQPESSSIKRKLKVSKSSVVGFQAITWE